jgi:hypothetical protein
MPPGVLGFKRGIGRLAIAAGAICLWSPGAAPGAAQDRVERYSIHEAAFEASGSPANPYVEIHADAKIRRPDGSAWTMPLFWDGARTWRLRISPDVPGKWSFTVASNDPGVNGRSGAFECVASSRPGGLRASPKWPSHFERQNGTPFWFMGDTAWGYFTDSKEDNHHRSQAERYAKKRAAQGFNVIHSMMLSEQGVGNNNGFPFEDIAAERINPAYWREVDERLAFANRQGLTVGLAIAWGDKRRVEPFAWRKFPNVEARKRYARYAAARYGAYDVYFLVAGEWHGEVRTREKASDEEVFREFVAIGDALAAANPHGRMIGIHPMSAHGSVREFASAAWMSFADYQQNYRDLHARAALSRTLRGPVVNSEYGYYLRDQNGDGKPDKDNSHTLEDMRFASWDIVMAGAYFVTGFGTTYFGGHRDPGPFDVDAAKNADWEAQVGLIGRLFAELEWWKLVPAADLVSSTVARGADRRWAPATEKGRRDLRPPAAAYWALAEPGETYLAYVRGTTEPVELETEARTRRYRVRLFNPRTGEFTTVENSAELSRYTLRAPDRNDWLLLLQAVK